MSTATRRPMRPGRVLFIVCAVLMMAAMATTSAGCKKRSKDTFPVVVPSASVTTPAGVQEGVFEVSYTLYDRKERPVDVIVEFSESGSGFASCTRAPGGQPVSGLATDTTGISYTFRWNSVADSVALTSQVDTVIIRVTPVATSAGGLPIKGRAGKSDEFSVDNTTANNPPVVEITSSPTGIQSGDVTAGYSITDAEVDDGYIEVLYKTESMTDWEPATLVSGTGGTVEGNFVVNMTCPIPPAFRSVVWDSLTDIGQNYAHEVQLRIIGHDAQPGAPADTGIFHVDNTPVPVPPLVTLTTPASPSRGLVTMEYEISDNNAEYADMLFELSLDGGGNWQALALVYCDAGQRVDNIVIDVPCLPTPVIHHVIWDSAADIGFTANYAVRLRAKTDSGVQGTWVETGDFAVDNTPPAGGPTAVITADKLSAQTGEDIQFSAMSSTGSPTTFHWSFGDGSYSSATEPVHAFQTGDGVFNVMLTVTDTAGLYDTAMQPVKITELITDYRTELEPYRNYSETRAVLEQLADAYPDIMMVYNIGYSVMGREIYAVKISDNVTVDEDEPTLHFDGEHHAREVMMPEIMIDIAEQLVTNYSPASPEVKGWVDDYEIYLIPCVNPDGSVAVFTSDWSIRKNANGVDLNRNYPADWGNPAGSSGNPGSETYRGPFPASEPEVQTVMAHAFRTRPSAGITFHSYSNIVLYPYSSPGLTQTSQEDYIRLVAEDMAAGMTRDIGGPYVAEHALWYDASGVTFDWMYRDVGTFCMLIEVGDSLGGGLNGFHPDYATYHDSQVHGVRGGVVELFRYMNRGAIYGHVTEDGTGEPIEADIEITPFDNPNGEIRRSEPAYGSFYWLWQNGTFDITVTCEGYETQIFSGVTIAGAPYELDVQLVKEAPGNNHRPTASFTSSLTKFQVGTTVFFDATGSTDEDGDSLTYFWDFGDDHTSTEPTPTHTFNRTGTHRVVLVVDDGSGGQHETWNLVHVMPASEAPHVTLQAVPGTWSRDVYVDYDLSCPTTGLVSISVEYTYDGLVWHAATIAGADEGVISGSVIGSVYATAEPAPHYFLWDSLTDLGTVGATNVALRVVPYVPDVIYGDPAITNIFTVDNTASNSPPSVTLNVEDPPHANDITFLGVISDPDSESCSLTIEYSINTGTNWLPATVISCEDGVIAGNVISGLAALASGNDYSFEWDSRTDIGIAAVSDVWMRVTPNDSEADGTSALLTGLVINNVGLYVDSPTSSDTCDATCGITWFWDSTAGQPEENLVYEIDYARGAGTVYFYNDFRMRPDSADWETTGDTYWDESRQVMVLDRNAGNAGGLWFTGDIPATEWYCSFRFRITGGPRARGLYFSFYSLPTTSQTPPDGYTVEFDANYNSGTDPYNVRHVALLDGTGQHLCYAPQNDFSDGSWHTAEISYKDGTILIDLDGSNVLGYWIETPDMSSLRFGFGARHHDGRAYYLDDVFLCRRKPIWTSLVTTTDGVGTSGGTGSYIWDTSTISSGTDYIVRIRAYGGGYASYSYSEPFTVEHSGTPSVSLTDPAGTLSYEVPLEFYLSDPTDDICWVNLKYSTNGTTWNDATIKSVSTGTIDGSFVTGLDSGATGPFTVTWNAWRDIGENSEPTVRLRLIPFDTLPGTDAQTTDFAIDNTAHAGELSGFAAAINGGNVELTWNNPTAPSLDGIRIVRRDDGAYPSHPTDGDIVYDSNLTGTYYDTTHINGVPVLVRQDAQIDFSWGDPGSPDPLIPDDLFSARWTATFDTAEAGPWNFYTVSEDGARLFIDGDLVVDRFVAQSVHEYCGYKMLGIGRHTVVMEYIHYYGNCEAHLYQTGPGITRGVVPLLPGRTTSYIDRDVSGGNTYRYTAFTYTSGGTFSTGVQAIASP